MTVKELIEKLKQLPEDTEINSLTCQSSIDNKIKYVYYNSIIK